MNAALAGAVSGITATVPMSVAMLGVRRVFSGHRQHKLPPEEITEELIDKAHLDEDVSQNEIQIAALVSHFAYGGLAGTLFPLTVRRVPGPAILKGAGFGVLVWALSYAGYLPVLRLQPALTEQPQGRNVAMIGAHLVWGAALAWSFDKLRNCPKRNQTNLRESASREASVLLAGEASD